MTPTMRIAYVAPHSRLFGAERTWLEWMRALTRARFTPFLLTMTPGPLEEEAAKLDIPVTRLPWLNGAHLLARPWRALPAVARLSRWLRANHIAILELNMLWGVDLGVLRLATWMAGSRLVVQNRVVASWPSLDQKFWLSRADRLVSIARGATTQWLRPRRSDGWSRIRPERLAFIPDSREIAAIQATASSRALVRALGVPDHGRIIGMVAALDRRKRQDLFLRAAAALARRHADVWFVLVGKSYEIDADGCSAYEHELQELAASLGLTSRVIFTGYRHDAVALMKHFAVLVLPSKREGMGGVLIEALTLGVPVVAARTGGIPEVIDDGVTGLLVEPTAPADTYAQAIGYILEHAPVAMRMRQAARERAGRFDNAHVGRMIERGYEALVPGFPRGHGTGIREASFA